jgi:O-antigen ligase
MNNAARNGRFWLALALPFTLALVFSGAFSAPFSAPKNAIFVAATFALGAFALIFPSGWRPKREEWGFWTAVAVYVALIAVSTMRSEDRSMCMESAKLQVCGVLLFAASLGALARKDKAAIHLQTAISAAAVLVSLVTVAQFFGMNTQGAFGFNSNFTGRMRMYATLGNPDFVATFLAVALPSAIGLTIMAQRLRALWISASVLIGLATILTGSRGGVLALAAGVTVMAFTAMHKRALIVAAVLAACALAAGTQLNARTPWESLRGRILIWQVTLGEGTARSAWGSGPGTLAYDFPARLGHFFAEPGRQPLLHFAGNENHAQNDFVEAWHDTGWLGLGGLFALLGSWFTIAIRRLRASRDGARPAISAAIASVSALCIASLFDFPMHRAETWALLWLSMAVPLVSPARPPAPQRRRAWLRCAAAALYLAAGSYAAFAPLAASYELARGESEEDHDHLESSQDAYRAALRWEPSSPDANFDLVRAVAKTGNYPGALSQSIIAMRYVNEPALYILRSRILQNAGRNGDARSEVEAAARTFTYSMELRKEVASFPQPGTAAKGR